MFIGRKTLSNMREIQDTEKLMRLRSEGMFKCGPLGIGEASVTKAADFGLRPFNCQQISAPNTGECTFPAIQWLPALFAG